MNTNRIVLLFALLSTGCAHLDPLGSPSQQARLEDVEYSADYPTRSGVICRELAGSTSIYGVDGAARGARCLEVGPDPFTGCMKWEFPGGRYLSAGCYREEKSEP